mgnify:CR=1 FL=1
MKLDTFPDYTFIKSPQTGFTAYGFKIPYEWPFAGPLVMKWGETDDAAYGGGVMIASSWEKAEIKSPEFDRIGAFLIKEVFKNAF